MLASPTVVWRKAKGLSQCSPVGMESELGGRGKEGTNLWNFGFEDDDDEESHGGGCCDVDPFSRTDEGLSRADGLLKERKSQLRTIIKQIIAQTSSTAIVVLRRESGRCQPEPTLRFDELCMIV